MPSGVEAEVQHDKHKEKWKDPKTTVSPIQRETAPESAPIMEKNDDTEQGVEVELGKESNPTMVESPGRSQRESQEQKVFRPPTAVRPQAMRAPGGPPPPPPPPRHPYHIQSAGSWGYGHSQPPGDYRGRPYPVPPYNPSPSSFDEPSYHPTPHYSPSVSYTGYRTSEDVNVISPNHKGDPHHLSPPTPRSRNMPPPNYYNYPPSSPVSRHEMPGTARRGRNNPTVRRDGPYSRAQRCEPHPDDVTWTRYPVSHSPARDRQRPQVVTESSFDSEHVSRESHGSHPHTPRSTHTHTLPPALPPSDPHYQNYGSGGSWGSFDSAAGPVHHFDDHRYYGYPHLDSPYGYYQAAPYSAPEIYRTDSFPHPGVHPAYTGHHPPNHGAYPHSFDEEERSRGYGDFKTKNGQLSLKSSSRNSNSASMLLPKAAEEIDFDVTDPPPEPVTQPSEKPVCESLANVNGYDVLCGRGGGTNSQVGNRRFRKLVQEFQPTYLLARRKEKPLLARTIVLIIRKRGGRFLKKDDETGELYEVGDTKAEAKTSQALREGLDVRATKSAASSLLEKKKKKQLEEQQEAAALAALEEDSPKIIKASSNSNRDEKKTPTRGKSPPVLPRLQGEETKSGSVHPHSPEQYADRKRQRTRPVSAPGDRFFPDFCPPRAEMTRQSPSLDDDSIVAAPMRRDLSKDEEDHFEETRGCAGIAFDVMTGAATGSFCLGPTGWRR